jgi:hypothetical protein
VDIFTVHDYYRGLNPPDTTMAYTNGWGGATPLITSNAMATLQINVAATGKTIPAHVNEFGMEVCSPLFARHWGIDTVYPLLSWERGRDRYIKSMVLYRAGGATAFCFHAMPYSRSATITNIHGQLYDTHIIDNAGWDYLYRGPMPCASAYLMTAYRLNGCSLASATNIGVLWHVNFTNAAKMIEFYWTLEGTTTNLPSLLGLASDIYGNPILTTTVGSMPLIVSGRRP